MKAKNDISIVLCGEAGQGIKTIDFALTKILKQNGFYVFSTKEYMSRIRGGCNSTEIRVSDQPVNAYVNRIDILIPLSSEAVSHVKHRISKNTLIIGKTSFLSSDAKSIEVDFEQLVDDKTYINSAAIGVILGLLNADEKHARLFFKDYFKDKGQAIIRANIEAINKGFLFAKPFVEKNHFKLTTKDKVNSLKLMNGSEAVSLGALYGGCNFVSAYPMSPSTGVLTNMANYSQKYDVLVEQVEDEIAGINMAQGAWYAGARALVTTSGGGFALMSEGISLSGMTETPVVIHLAQRPGPATGLPTRTEQSDLNLALYVGHGEFPRIIFAPGSNEHGFHLAQKAFDLADKYQIPVIIITDQYFLDSYSQINTKDLKKLPIKYHIVKTKKDYQRYALTNDGISPRGIPKNGSGMVRADSDEHTEEGVITEDLNIRTKMVEKRLKKVKSILKDSVTPEFMGTKNYKTLIVSWGSNYHVIKEALCHINDKNLALLHFSQVYPLYQNIKKYFDKAKKIIVVENNATGQFAGLIKKELNVKVDEMILKFNGLPFSVEEMIRKLKK